MPDRDWADEEARRIWSGLNLKALAAALRSARRKALDDAAKLAEEPIRSGYLDPYSHQIVASMNSAGIRIAQEIRALADGTKDVKVAEAVAETNRKAVALSGAPERKASATASTPSAGEEWWKKP